ncbi:RNase H domain-containing protein [Trichonephila clavipes]|nr:RNase H domain-containing protein [Trichonephila clavipes]
MDIPEFTAQIVLETIHGIPHSALKIYTDGNMCDGGISGSGVHIETLDGTFDIKIRNINCAVLFLAPFSLDNCWGMTSLNILDVGIRLYSRHSIYFQWVPSHIGLDGNEIAGSLAKSATADALRGDACLTFAALSSIKRMELNALWRVPLAHPWYFGRKPRWCHQLNIPRDRQTVLSCFFSGHIKSFTF